MLSKFMLDCRTQNRLPYSSIRWFWARGVVPLFILIFAAPGAFAPFAIADDNETVIAIPSNVQQPTQLMQAAQPVQATQAIGARELSRAFRSAAERALPCVVMVFAKKPSKDEKLEQIETLEFLEGEPGKDYNIGSGVILSSEGLIVTNHHVVADSKRVRIRLPDGREFPATDIRSDAMSDLAILRIDSTKPLPFVELAESSGLGVGDWVLAIGSPFAIEQTVSAGIISGKARSLPGLVNGQLLQTDAAINPGNSGGALVNLDGQLVGINTAIASSSGSYQGVGFAIPSNRVRWVTSELTTYSKVRRATMGITIAPLPVEIADQLDLPIRGGVIVVRMRSGQAAEKAGLKKGDVIVKLGDQVVRSPADLASIVEQLPIDQPQPVTILREAEQIVLDINLLEKTIQ